MLMGKFVRNTGSSGLQLLIMRSQTFKCARINRSVQLLCVHVPDNHTKHPWIRAVGWQQHGAKGNYRGDILIIASWSSNHLSRLAASAGGPDTPLLQRNPTRSQAKDKVFPEYASSAPGSTPRQICLNTCPTRHPDQIHKPPQLTPLGVEKQVEGTHSSRSCRWPCSFDHRPRLMTMDEGPQYCRHCDNLSTVPFFPPLWARSWDISTLLWAVTLLTHSGMRPWGWGLLWKVACGNMSYYVIYTGSICGHHHEPSGIWEWEKWEVYAPDHLQMCLNQICVLTEYVATWADHWAC